MFRSAALKNAETHRQYGEVVLQHSVSSMVLVALFVAIAVSFVVFFCTFSVTRKAQVAGVLLPSHGAIRLASPQAGVVTEQRVREGAVVEKGDVLLVLSGERASPYRESTLSAVSDLLARRLASLRSDESQQHFQAEQRIATLRQRAEALRTDAGRLVNQIMLQRQRVALSEEALARHAGLLRNGFVSPAALEQRRAELIDQQQRLAELERAKAASDRELLAASAEARDVEIQSGRDWQAAARGMSLVEQDLAENEARRTVLIRASQPGVVTGLTVNSGQAVAAGQLLATIIPDGSELEAELYVPSRAAGFIRMGMPVLLRYQGYPYQKFGQHAGVVREVSEAALSPDEIVGASKAGEPIYRVRVKLDSQGVMTYGTLRRLRSGMALDASVLLETRKLYEWVLDPLYGITGRR